MTETMPLFPISRPTVLTDFAGQIRGLSQQVYYSGREPVFICIGTDRSTGDSLGPLIGSRLQRTRPDLHIYGTLDEPIHATNITTQLETITASFDNPYIIAVDACLGRLDHVGTLTIGYGSVHPGAAVRKNLPPVGDAYITGVVNVSGFMEPMVLQSTRLSLVMKMSELIASSIFLGFHLPESAAAIDSLH